MKSRWYPQTLKKRITAIIEMRDRITFIEDDGLEVMKEYASRPDAVFFVDPPYTAAGKMAGRRLYTHADLDHEELFRVASGVAGDFLMTYDDAERVRKLGGEQGFDMEFVAMKSAHHAEMAELLIGRNLDWARDQ